MGPLFIAVCELLIFVASLAVDHGLQAHGLQSQARWSWCMGFSCSSACGIFLDEGSYPWPLHWLADSYLLYHQRIWVWDLASPFLQLIFKWDEYFCLFKRDGWGRTAVLTSILGFSVWLFSESELPGIFFFLFCSSWSYVDLPLLHHYCSCPTYWGLCSQHLLLSTGLCQGEYVWFVTISNSQAPTPGWTQHPQSSCSPAGTFPTLRPAKRPPISAEVLGIVYHAFQGVSDSNLVGLSLVLLSWLLCFIGKFREIKKLNAITTWFSEWHFLCQLQIVTCHLPPQGLNNVLLQLLTFNTPERSSGWRAEMSYSVLGRKLVGQVFRYIFSGGADFESNFCISSYLEKH